MVSVVAQNFNLLINDIWKLKYLKLIVLNFGPQHPSAHGVLWLILNLEGERILWAEPQVGLLHWGTEKLVESKSYFQIAPYLDWLDYVSMMAQEHVYSLIVEILGNFNIPYWAKLLWVLLLEITWLLNHLLNLTTQALDVGAMTPLLWLFEEWEKLLEFYEWLSGARMHANYVWIGGLLMDVPVHFFDNLNIFIEWFIGWLQEFEELLTLNWIWKYWLVNIGQIDYSWALWAGFSGILLWSCGFKWDIWILMPYEAYDQVKFFIPLSFCGDSFDRYLLWIEEMRQSLYIILQIISNISLGSIKLDNFKITLPSISLVKTSMEALIHHFKLFTSGLWLNSSLIYCGLEAPKGEFGITLLTRYNNFTPYRLKFRAPGFFHLQALNKLVWLGSISDLVTIIGSQDIVFGEIDW